MRSGSGDRSPTTGLAMKAKLLRLVIVFGLAALVCPSPGNATTYDYAGNPLITDLNSCFSEPTGGGCSALGPLSLFASVTFDFDTSDTSGTFDVVTEFSNVIPAEGTVTLSSGVITSWYISGSDSFGGGHGSEVLDATSATGGDEFLQTLYSDPESPPFYVYYTYGYSDGPGTWSCDDCAPTPLPATPLPASLPLFATGLGVMGLFGWRRKRSDVAGAAA